MDHLFINISNHPSTIWGEKQMNAAKQCGLVMDLPFPMVSTTAKKEDIVELAASVIEQVQELTKNNNSSTIHVMGEMCLTYSLVRRLKSLGYRCVASTTQRNVIDNKDGSKTSVFEFVGFREYE